VATVSRFNNPEGIAVSRDGRFLLVADRGNRVIRRVSAASGATETIAGSGATGVADGAGRQAQFWSPSTVAISPSGTAAYVADETGSSPGGRIRGISLSTYEVFTLSYAAIGAGVSGVYPSGLGISLDGLYLYAIERNNIVGVDTATGCAKMLAGQNGAGGYTSEEGPALQALYSNPQGLAVHGSTLYMADSGNNAVRVIDLVPHIFITCPQCKNNRTVLPLFSSFVGINSQVFAPSFSSASRRCRASSSSSSSSSS
jgi:DNA-binding beta-propeller fold protein YncE